MKIHKDVKIGEAVCSKCGWTGPLPQLEKHICTQELAEGDNAWKDFLRAAKLFWNQGE